MLKAYSMHTRTKDGFRVLLGGLCPGEWFGKIEQQLLGMQHLTFGNYCDPYEIDYRFVQLLSCLQSGLEEIPYVLAGIIAVPDAIARCGAVLGSPANPCTSADVEENPLLLLSDPSIYSVCYPGNLGAAFASDYNEACQIADALHDLVSSPLAASHKKAAALIREKTSLYVVCSDIRPYGGSGWVGGNMTVSDAGGKKELFL